MSDIPTKTVEGMSMMDHLRELRMRLVRSVLAVGISTLVLLAFYDQLKNLFIGPTRWLHRSDESVLVWGPCSCSSDNSLANLAIHRASIVQA